MSIFKDLPYDGNWSFTVLTYPTAAISNDEYNRKLKQASESFTFDYGKWLKKTSLISGENLNYILDDLEEQLKDKKLPESNRQSIESMLETFSEAKGSIEYCFIMHFGLPFTEDKEVAYQNMMKVRNGYIKRLNEMYIGTVLIKDEDDILQIIDGMLTGEFYIGARLNAGKLIPVTKEHFKKPKDHDLAYLACVDSIESDPDGNYVYINNRTVASSILVGKQNLNVSFQPNYGDDFTKNWSVEELINISKKENTAVIWCHVEIPIVGERYNSMFGERKKKAEQSEFKTKAGQMNPQNAAFNEHESKKLDQNIKATMKGERYVYFALIGIVLGKSKENVNAVIDNIKSKLKDGKIKSVSPKFGHFEAIRMCLPINYIHSKFLQIVSSSTSAALLPLRNNNALDEKEGPIVCRDALTKVPIRICPSLKDPDNTFMVTPTGKGKTAFACAWANRVIDAGEKAYIIEPKNENRNIGNTRGTDYKTYCQKKNGVLIDFSVEEMIPGLLVIPFDKKLFGDKTWAYQKAADMHFDYVEYSVGAWLGKELTAGQKSAQTTRLMKLYQKGNILDKKGRVINTKDWDNPKVVTWPGYEDIRDMIYATRNPKTGIIPNPSDRSLYEATAKAGKGMTYWKYFNSKKRIQAENNLVVFDLSGLPKGLSEAFSIYLMEYINLSYLPKDPDSPAKRVYIFWDEIYDLINNEVTAPQLENGARKGRAELVTNIYITQNTYLPGDKFKSLLSNCRNVFLFCNLTSKNNVNEIMSAFNIDEQYRTGLQRQGYEIGYLLRDGYTRDVDLKLTKFEKKYLFGEEENEDETEIETGYKPEAHSGLAVEEYLQDILNYEGFFTEDDVISGIKNDYEPEYKWYNLQYPFSTGSVNCWILSSCIKPRDKPENQDIIGPVGQKGVEGHKHYGFGCMVLGWMRRYNHSFPDKQPFPNARYDHTGGPDIVWGEFDKAGKLIECENSGCIEIEGHKTHGLTEWNEKVNRAQLSGYKNIIFTGDSVVCREMRTAKPPAEADYINKVKAYVYPQGKALLKELDQIATANINRKPQDLSRLNDVTEQTEELETSV